MRKPVLVVTTHFVDGIEARIDRDYKVGGKPAPSLVTQPKP
jgi:hypothetical protein